MLDINDIKEDMEQKYQEAVEITQNLECKYGFNEEDEYYICEVSNMELDDRIEYECNLQVMYTLSYFLSKYINPEIK